MIAVLLALAVVTATPVPTKEPVSVELCTGDAQSQTNPNLKVAIGFRNLTDVDITRVQFDILLLDESDKVVDTRPVAIDGKFGPNVLILPRRAPFTDAPLTQPEYPDSPAWIVADHFGSGVESVRCEVHSVKFADGTSWNRPSSI